jgi:uncharacterized membrane protein YhaH (DUF805 family)
MSLGTYNWTHFFLSFRGRIARSDFWIRYVLLFKVVIDPAVNGFFLIIDKYVFHGLAVPLLVLFGLVSIWVDSAVLVKRCHDRNYSGWPVLILLVPYEIFELKTEFSFVPELRNEIIHLAWGWNLLIALVGLLLIIAIIRQLFDLAFLRGTAGENHFGPDPLQSPGALSKKAIVLCGAVGIGLVLYFLGEMYYVLGGMYYFLRTGHCPPLFCN